MEIDLNKFRDVFFQEAEEHLTQIEADLLRLERGERDTELLDSIFRGAHSLKGASGTFGFEDLCQFTHAMETLLDQLRGGRATSPAINALLFRALDVLKELVEAARENAAAPSLAKTLAGELIAIASNGQTEAENPSQPTEPTEQTEKRWRIHFAPAPEVFQHSMDPILILRELAQLGEILSTHVDSSRLPKLAAMDPEVCYLAWDVELATTQTEDELRDVFAFVEDGADLRIESLDHPPGDAQSFEPQPLAPSALGSKRTPENSSIRVATEKVDRIIDLVGELVIAQSMAAQILQDFTPASLNALREAFEDLERHTRELQERVMTVRMIPVASLFNRFPRLVRDLAAATGKNISLQLSGEETELDKAVVDSLGDPLTHIIRNCADHGMETPSERRERGKPPECIIHLHTFHEGGNVIVEIDDDGRGLDAQRIRAKAIKRNMISEDAQLTEQEIHELIFVPGFSTAETITGISGRGVGMDVVRRNIRALNGTVTIKSVQGSGTRVRIKLPLTMAILEGLLVKVGPQTYVLPLTSILESIRPKKSQLNSLAGQAETVVVRGEPLRLLRLHQLFNVTTAITDPAQGLAVLVENHGKRLALLVDELLGQQQVVVKSLESNFRKLDGIVGATILGDGHAALILDVSGLVQMDHGVLAAV